MAWDWVERQLTDAGTYWVVAISVGHPHPRPVWGVWRGGLLHLSIGSPALLRQLDSDGRVTVHLDSGTDVVIVHGRVDRAAAADDGVLDGYRQKYGRSYDTAEYGALTTVCPLSVLAWRTDGWAGSAGFSAAAKWTIAAE